MMRYGVGGKSRDTAIVQMRRRRHFPRCPEFTHFAGETNLPSLSHDA
jgi:hypothetical protein